MENVQVKYTCFAIPPEDIQLNKTYSVGKDYKGYFYMDGKTIKYSTIDYIKMLFSPVEKTWDEVLTSKIK